MSAVIKDLYVAPNADNVIVTGIPGLKSTFALEQFKGLAKKMAKTDFILWCAGIFGFEPAEDMYKAYEAMREALLNDSFENPPIMIITTDLDPAQHQAGYDHKQNTIKIIQQVVDDAEDDEEKSWLLLIILMEEFGHHVDYAVRNIYSSVGGDAALDEGALYAYAILYFDYQKTTETQYAVYCRLGEDVEMKVHYKELNQAVNKWLSLDEIIRDEKNENLEFFGAGMGRGNCSYAHEKIEQALAKAGFTKDQLKEIYFGNWMRDYSQIVDPKLLRDPAVKDPGLTDGFTRDGLTKIVDYLSRAAFGEKTGSDGNRLFHVTKDRLGLYRPDEHMDNPCGMYGSAAENAKVLRKDPQFRPGCTPDDLLVDTAGTWVKKYINSAGPYTSATFMKNQLALAYSNGNTMTGRRHLGAALHTLEDTYAHTNFVELALIEHGKYVYPWVKKMAGSTKHPLVSGTFGSLDTIASVGTEIAQKMEKIVDCDKNEPGQGMQLALIVLGDIKLGFRKAVEFYIHEWQKLVKDHPWLKYPSLVLCKTITYYLQFVNVVFGYTIHQACNVIDDGQTEFANNEENPTHSQLSKDHDDHPLHEVASLCAMDAAETVGRYMQQAWKKQISLADLQKHAVKYLVHPAKVGSDADLLRLTGVVKAWADKPTNQAKIDRAASKTFLEYQVKRNKDKLKYLEELSKKYLGNKSGITEFIQWLLKKAA